MPQDALAMLKDGNERFAMGGFEQDGSGSPLLWSDSRVPLETVFDGAIKGAAKAFLESKKSGGPRRTVSIAAMRLAKFF